MIAKKKYGQNFLINKCIIDDIISLCDAKSNDLIVEIGPGMGALTSKLAKLSSQLICIEIDTDMKKFLDKYESEKVHVIYEDILSINLKKILDEYTYDNLYIIGNLPYYITSPIIEYLIKESLNIYKMIFMVQNEVADRYSSKPGSSNYGFMSVFLNNYFYIKKEFKVLKKDFNPVPKVDSAIITFYNQKCIYDKSDDSFINFIKEAFLMKRKTLKNNLKKYDFNVISKILNKYDISDNVRAEDIDVIVYKEIYDSIK